MVRTYQRSWFAHDIVAGLVLTAILVPVGIGYAEAAGLPAIYGLYADIFPLLAYAVFGPSRILVLGPDSSLAAIIAATVRTPVAESAGAKTQLTGVAGAACIALLLLFAPALLQNLPSAILGAVVISACISLVDVRGVINLNES